MSRVNYRTLQPNINCKLVVEVLSKENENYTAETSDGKQITFQLVENLNPIVITDVQQNNIYELNGSLEDNNVFSVIHYNSFGSPFANEMQDEKDTKDDSVFDMKLYNEAVELIHSGKFYEIF